MFNKNKTEFEFLIKDTPEGQRAAIGMHCGRHVITLEPGCKLTDYQVKSSLRKLGFKPAKIKNRVYESKVADVLRADNINVIGAGQYSVIVEFDASTKLLSRVTIFDPKDYQEQDYLSKCQVYAADKFYWLHAVNKALQMKPNAEIQADFGTFREREARQYYDFKTVQIRADKAGFFCATDAATAVYLQSLWMLSRKIEKLDWRSSLAAYHFFNGIEIRFIYPKGGI